VPKTKRDMGSIFSTPRQPVNGEGESRDTEIQKSIKPEGKERIKATYTLLPKSASTLKKIKTAQLEEGKRTTEGELLDEAIQLLAAKYQS
jgi:hypothetical protein